jgi:hypothetical protein
VCLAAKVDGAYPYRPACAATDGCRLVKGRDGGWDGVWVEAGADGWVGKINELQVNTEYPKTPKPQNPN